MGNKKCCNKIWSTWHPFKNISGLSVGQERECDHPSVGIESVPTKSKHERRKYSSNCWNCKSPNSRNEMISKQDKIKAEKFANNSQLIEKTRQRFALVDLIRKTQRRKRRQVLCVCVCVPLSFDKVVTHGCYWNIKPHSGGQEFEWEACRRTHTHTHTRNTIYGRITYR